MLPDGFEFKKPPRESTLYKWLPGALVLNVGEMSIFQMWVRMGRGCVFGTIQLNWFNFFSVIINITRIPTTVINSLFIYHVSRFPLVPIFCISHVIIV